MTTTGSGSPDATDQGGGGGYVQGPPVTANWGPAAWPATTRDPLLEAVPAVTGRRLAALAVAIGVGFQLLFVGQAIGINAVLWTAVMLSSAAAARRRGTPFDRADA